MGAGRRVPGSLFTGSPRRGFRGSVGSYTLGRFGCERHELVLNQSDGQVSPHRSRETRQGLANYLTVCRSSHGSDRDPIRSHQWPGVLELLSDRTKLHRDPQQWILSCTKTSWVTVYTARWLPAWQSVTHSNGGKA